MGKISKQGALALGSIFLVLLPRAAPGVLSLAGAYCLARLPPTRDELRRLLFWVSLVAAYPVLSALWASEPRRALTIVGGTALIVVVSVLVYGRIGRLRDAFWPAVMWGIPAIVFVSLLDVLFGIPLRTALANMGVEWVGQPRMIGKTGRVQPSAANWSITVMALLLFPYLAATRQVCCGSISKQIIRLTVAAALGAAVLASPHQSSMLALCVGILVYGIACFSKTIALALVSVGWLVSICATPLLMRVVVDVPKFVSDEAPKSLRERFLIWRVALRDVEERPWVGTGVGSTRVYFREKRMNSRAKKKKFPGIAPHSHNWFLDLWRELGAIGAALASIFALLVSYRMYNRLERIPPEQIAFAGLVLSMSTASFSLWAVWYLSAIGIAFAMFGLTRTDLAEQQDAQIARGTETPAA